MGCIIRYAGSTNEVTYLDAHPAPDAKYNLSVPPDMLRFHFPDKIEIASGGKSRNRKYIMKLLHCTIAFNYECLNWVYLYIVSTKIFLPWTI